MGMLVMVLLILLALFFLLSVLLAIRLHGTDRRETNLKDRGSFMAGSESSAFEKVREKYFEEVILQTLPAPYQEYLLQSPSGRPKISFLPGSFSEKDMIMSTPIDAKKQNEMGTRTETIETERKELAAYGFDSDEIVSLLWLQKWYLSGGSDRVVLVRHWEFLRFLVLNGKLDP